ncbi:MAG: hypothetical protein U0835_12410 [Isosphaeraceae bacterium]
MRARAGFLSISALTIALSGLSGCGGGSPEGDLGPIKPASKEETEQISKQVQEGMKGGYKGAPGVPLKTQ